MSRFVLVVIFIFGMLCLPYLYRHHALPFRLSKSTAEIPRKTEWEMGEMPASVREILSQPFTYLGKGVQSYAFESQDGLYVLKLFLFDSSKMPFGQSLFNWTKQEVGRYVRKSRSPEEIFNSCKLSYDRAREETGLVWVQLNSERGVPVLIKDYLGFSHTIDMNRHRFVLQKKAVTLLPALRDARRNNPEKYAQMISSFAALLETFEQRGIASLDKKLSTNFGYLETKAIQIDFADNVEDPELAKRMAPYFLEKLHSKLKKK